MKKFISVFTGLIFFGMGIAGLFGAEQINYQNYELDTLLHEIDEPQAPIIKDDYIIFTCDPNHRYVGIAFDFENYKIIHPFKLLTHTDENDVVTKKHLFYCYKRDYQTTTIKYRLVIDGLWTTDPLNPNTEYDNNVNLYFSKVEDPEGIKFVTKTKEKNTVLFVYKGKSGERVNLAGTFTNWDPWIYELSETSPGIYELELPLPKGKYYYNYFIGLSPVLDNTNPEKIYTLDGRSASVISVD